MLLKNPHNLTDRQAATHRELRRAGDEVWRAYQLKEAVRGIFAPGLGVEDVEMLLDRLLSRLARSRLAPFVRLGRTIRKHRDGILAAVRLGLKQRPPRSTQQQGPAHHPPRLRRPQRRRALALVYLCCGPITLRPPHVTHALAA